MAFTDSLSALTADVIRPFVKDQLLERIPLFAALSRNAEMVAGGPFVRVPVRKSFSAARGVIQAYGDYNDTPVEQEDAFKFYWVFTYDSAVFSRIEAKKAGGLTPGDLALYVNSRMEGMRDGLTDAMESHLFDAGEQSNTLFEGLPVLTDDGTNYTTYGGVTRSSNTWSKAHYVGSVTPPLAQADLHTLVDELYDRGAVAGHVLLVCPIAVFSIIRALMSTYATYEKSTGTPAFHGGFTYDGPDWNGAPIITSNKATASTLYAVDLDSTKLVIRSDTNFEVRDDPQSNSDKLIKRIELAAALTSDRPNRSGQSNTITS